MKNPCPKASLWLSLMGCGIFLVFKKAGSGYGGYSAVSLNNLLFGDVEIVAVKF